MAISLKSLETSAAPTPPRILEYGVPGIGKTVLGVTAPKAIFIRTEDGLGGKMPDGTSVMETLLANGGGTFPLCKTFEEVIECLGSLYNEDHEFQTLVVDSCDWLDLLVQTYAAKKAGFPSCAEVPYGKGFAEAARYFKEMYLTGLEALRLEKNMTIIQIAHEITVKVEHPELDPYTRFDMKMHKATNALVREYSDAILFASYKIASTKTDVGFNRKQNKAVGTGERLFQTQDKPTSLAKNRFAMPETIPLSWESVASHIPYFNQSKDKK